MDENETTTDKANAGDLPAQAALHLRNKLASEHKILRELEIAERNRHKLGIGIGLSIFLFLLLCFFGFGYLASQFNRQRFRNAMELAAGDIGDGVMREAPELAEGTSDAYLNAFRTEAIRSWPKIVKKASDQYLRLEKYIATSSTLQVRETSKARLDQIEKGLAQKIDALAEDNSTRDKLSLIVRNSMDKALLAVINERLQQGRKSLVEGFTAAVRIAKRKPETAVPPMMQILEQQLDKFAERYGDGFTAPKKEPVQDELTKNRGDLQ